jgi:hypothetical protein
MVKSALWLLEEVGEGEVFTKEDLRKAFPGVAQVDRRVRDLRKYGWKILASTEDATLNAEEQRFVSKGLEVWIPSERRKVTDKTLSSKERTAILEAANFQCELCGISGGEKYPEDRNRSAVLLITSPNDGRSRVLCRLCSDGGNRATGYDGDRLLSELESLTSKERTTLKRWIVRGSRGPTVLDRVWNAFRTAPESTQTKFVDKLNSID